MAYEPSATDERRRIALEQSVAAKGDGDDAKVIVDRAEKFFNFLEDR